MNKIALFIIICFGLILADLFYISASALDKNLVCTYHSLGFFDSIIDCPGNIISSIILLLFYFPGIPVAAIIFFGLWGYFAGGYKGQWTWEF